jgi:hypothetical protein
MNDRIRSHRPRAILAALFGAGLLMLGAPGFAAAACPHNSTSNAFARFGDEAAYSLAPGGSFEEGQQGWSFSKASIALGNERFHLAPGTHSLTIAPGGTAASPWVCVSSEYPSFRLVVRQLSGGPEDDLGVSLRWINVLGITVNTPVADLQGGETEWAPTPVLQLGKAVPLWLPGSSLEMGLVFSAKGAGTWAIDDVFIDPYSR